MEALLVTDPEQLVSIEGSYNRLLERVGGIESLYYSIDYIRTSIDTFNAQGASLYFIVVQEQNEVVAVLPFQLVTSRAYGLKSTIKFWGEFIIYAQSVHQRILTDEFNPKAMDAAIALLNSELRNDWDTIEFTRTKVEDDNIRHFISSFPHSKMSNSGERFYYFDTSLDLDRHLGSKQMGNLRRRKKHLERDFGEVEFVKKETVSLDDLDQIKQLHTGRQNVKQNHGDFFSRPLERDYVISLINMWNHQKCIRYYSLLLAGKLIAFRVMIHAAGTTFGFVMAFDSEYRKYAPSRILTYEAFKHETEHFQTKLIETSWGTNQLKEDYSSGSYILQNITIKNRRLKSQIMLAIIDAAVFIATLLRTGKIALSKALRPKS